MASRRGRVREPSTSTVTLHEDGVGVSTLTLNRPTRKNAITETMVEEAIAALQEISRNPDVRVLIVTGAGDAFCSGMDLAGRVANPLSFMRRVGALCVTLRELSIPTIAKVNGPAMGFGCNLALCCDLLVIGESGVLGEVFAERGLGLDGGGSWTLPRLVGLSKAKEIVFFARRIGSEEAVALGLANLGVPDSELAETVAKWASRLANGPQHALSVMKAALNASVAGPFTDAVEREAVSQSLLSASWEAREGVQAFIERRPPSFRSRANGNRAP